MIATAAIFKDAPALSAQLQEVQEVQMFNSKNTYKTMGEAAAKVNSVAPRQRRIPILSQNQTFLLYHLYIRMDLGWASGVSRMGWEAWALGQCLIWLTSVSV